MRAIDPKYHIAGERIIKTGTRIEIPEDEPLILFRGRDRLALGVLRAYRTACLLDGCTAYHIVGIDNRIKAFEKFQREHSEQMKQPGCTLGR